MNNNEKVCILVVSGQDLERIGDGKHNQNILSEKLFLIQNY